MGFESHVDRELARSKTGLVRGEDYWFYDGLRTESLPAAFLIQNVLDESGEFGPARIVRVDNNFVIEFGIYRSFFNGTDKEYEEYCSDFSNGGLE